MIKMVLLDMDETLLVDFHVPLINQQAIKKAREQKVYVTPATGRSFALIQEILKEMGTKDCKGEYSICFNGGAIYENCSNEPLYYRALDYEQVRSIYEVCEKNDLCFMAFSLNKIFMYRPSESEIARKTKQKADFVIETDLTCLKDQKIIKAVIQSDHEEELYEIGLQEAQRFEKEKIEVSFSSGRFMECTCKGVSKGSALHWIKDYLHLEIDEIMAVGDNFNDIEMLKEAGLGVCVGDGRQEAKEAADQVTERGYRDGAVAEALERFVLHAEE